MKLRHIKKSSTFPGLLKLLELSYALCKPGRTRQSFAHMPEDARRCSLLANFILLCTQRLVRYTHLTDKVCTLDHEKRDLPTL